MLGALLAAGLLGWWLLGENDQPSTDVGNGDIRGAEHGAPRATIPVGAIQRGPDASPERSPGVPPRAAQHARPAHAPPGSAPNSAHRVPVNGHPLQRMVGRYSVDNLGLPALLARKLRRPLPKVVWQLLDLRQAGAGEAVQLDFVRKHFPRDLALKGLTASWIRGDLRVDEAAPAKKGWHPARPQRVGPAGSP